MITRIPVFTESIGTDLYGHMLTTEQLNDKVVLAICAQRNVVEDAHKLAHETLLEFGSHEKFGCLMVPDLSALPRFSWPVAKRIILSREARAKRDLEQAILSQNKTYTPPKLWRYIPDWEGKLTRSLLAQSSHPEYAFFKEDRLSSDKLRYSGSNENRADLRGMLQSFILDYAGNSIHHFPGDHSTSQIVPTLQTMLQNRC
ncbi:MAG: hypothetical protein AAFW75_11970 [Cyanobacteria bacterium J06636_16]